jgi:hypothetical protein
VIELQEKNKSTRRKAGRQLQCAEKQREQQCLGSSRLAKVSAADELNAQLRVLVESTTARIGAQLIDIEVNSQAKFRPGRRPSR